MEDVDIVAQLAEEALACDKVEKMKELVRAIRVCVGGAGVTGSCSYNLFYTRLTARVGHGHGSLVAYRLATRVTEGVDPVTVTQIDQWRRKGLVPAQRLMELPRLLFQPRPRGYRYPSWSDHELGFLASTHLADVTVSNRRLATLCSADFHREISENAVKGALDRLRMAQVVPALRPSHTLIV